LWIDGKASAPLEYPLVGTPCETVMRGGLCHHRTNVRALFPDDEMLAEMGLDSYLGAPLHNARGHVVGVINVLGDRPFDAALDPESIVKLCAALAEAEMVRLESQATLTEREEQLRQITESMQEIFWLAAWPGLEILYVSPSFEPVFGR